MDKMYVDGHPNLYRDLKSGAIINENEINYNLYMQQYQTRQIKSHRIDNIENDLNSLKSEISEIKSLLLKLNERSSVN
jgi:hypothetical protein